MMMYAISYLIKKPVVCDFTYENKSKKINVYKFNFYLLFYNFTN